MRSVVRVDEQTEISLDDVRSFKHFLRIVAGPARLDLSLQTASDLHDMLNDYFGPPAPPADSVEVRTLADDEPIAYLPTDKREATTPDLLGALHDSVVAARQDAA